MILLAVQHSFERVCCHPLSGLNWTGSWPNRHRYSSRRGLEVADQLHLAIEWPDGHQGPTNNRRTVFVFPLHCGASVKTQLADNVTIDNIDGRMWFFDHFLGQLSEGSFNTLSEDEILAAQAENMGALEPVDDFLEIPPAQDDAGVLLVIGNLSGDKLQEDFSFVRTLHIGNLTDEQAERLREGAEHLDALFRTWERVGAEYAALRQEMLATNAMAITRRNAITGFEVLPSTRCVDAAFSS